jgi:hypothetical protein
MFHRLARKCWRSSRLVVVAVVVVEASLPAAEVVQAAR